MLWKLFNLASLVSLLLFVSVCALWAGSYFGDGIWFPNQPAPASSYLSSVRGMLRLRVCADTPTSDPSTKGMAVYRPLADETENRAGREGGEVFDYGFVIPDRPYSFFRFWALSIPHAYLALMTILLPACWLISTRSRRRRMLGRVGRGLCAVCGYDLRTSPDRCPECGAVDSFLRV